MASIIPADDQLTYLTFGYHIQDLKRKDKCAVLYYCTACSAVVQTKNVSYRNTQFTRLCRSCSLKKSHADPSSGYNADQYRKMRSEITTRYNKSKERQEKIVKRYSPYIDEVLAGKTSYREVAKKLGIDDSAVCVWFHKHYGHRSRFGNKSLEEECVFVNLCQLFADIKRQVRYNDDSKKTSDFWIDGIGHIEYDGAGFWHIMKKESDLPCVRLSAQAYHGGIDYLRYFFKLDKTGYTACKSPREYTVKLLDKQKMATDMLLSCHPLGTCPGTKTYGLFYQDKLIGVGKWGVPTNPSDKGKLELRRFFILDGTPRNTESWFLSQMEKRLSEITLVSYIHAHEKGSYLKACGWTCVRTTGPALYDAYLIGNKLYSKRIIWGYAKRVGLVDKLGSSMAKETLCALMGGRKIIEPKKIKFEKTRT